MTSIVLSIAATIVLTLIPGLQAQVPVPQTQLSQESPMPQTHRAEWLARGSYGMMVHYLIAPTVETTGQPAPTTVSAAGRIAPASGSDDARTRELNRIVDAFDLDFFITQFESSGADWLIFTIGQNTGYYCSPNAWLDKHLPGHTSRRDLVSEIAQRVRVLNKHMIVYLPVEVAGQSAEVKQAFGWIDNDLYQREFLDRYLEFVRAYSARYGDLEQGWWFDGCYPPVHHGNWDWSRWIEAAKSGNPDSIVALSDATFVVGITGPVTPLQDYLGGEVHLLEDGKIRMDFISGPDVYRDADGHLRKRGQEPVFYLPESQYVEGVQWHALVPIDSTFNPDVPNMHYTDEELFGFVKRCKSVGGAVTLNAPVGLDGHVPDETMAQLQRLGKTLKK